jgi:hypothetical protein
MADLTKAQEAEVKKEVDKRLLNRLKEGVFSYRGEFRKQTLTAIIAAFGLVIALSWQTVIKGFIGSIPKSGILLYHPYLADLYTAIVVTVVSVAAILLLSHWSQKAQSP